MEGLLFIYCRLFYFFNEFLNTYALLGAILIVLSGIVSIPGQIKQVNEK